MNLYVIHLAIFFIALIFTFLITPVIGNFAKKIGAVDHPTERKVHREPVPRLGGVSIYIGFITAFGLYMAFSIGVRGSSSSEIIKNNMDLIGILIGTTFVFLFGCIDDIFQITARFKFFGQLAAAAIVVSFGVVIEFIGNPLAGGLINIPRTFGIILTIFCSYSVNDVCDICFLAVSAE